jgi:hypothetical protein
MPVPKKCLDTLLDKFLGVNARKFRDAQNRLGFLISGSFALHVMQELDEHSTDLDVYCLSSDFHLLAALLFSFGFVFRARAGQLVSFHENVLRPSHQHIDPNYPSRTVAGVFDFEQGGNIVQLVVCEGSMLAAILGFHSSMLRGLLAYIISDLTAACVMNFISYHYAIALYPTATLRDTVSLDLRPLRILPGSAEDLAHVKAVGKYRDKGWTIIDKVHSHMFLNVANEFSWRVRMVGDELCRVVAVSTEAEVARGRLPDVIFLNSWCLSVTTEGFVEVDSILRGTNIGQPICTAPAFPDLIANQGEM